MPTQFILNLFIATLWFLLRDDPNTDFTDFVAGFLVGVFILYAMHRFFGTRFYLQRLFKIVRLILLFIAELILSSYSVLKLVLSPKLNIKPGIFKYKTQLSGDWEITVLALLLTLTPGSVVMEVSESGDEFYIHAMDLESTKESIMRSLGNFERAIMEVTRSD